MGILISLYALAVMVDGIVTDYRIHRHGLRVEMNPVIRGAVRAFGTVVGLALGIAVPAIGLAYLASKLGITVLSFLTGMRVMWMWKQLMALRVSGV
jgi:hypothetical protein